MLYKFYYLLYKLVDKDILWIIDESEDFCNLKKSVKNFISDIEKYYIVVTKYTKDEIDLIYNKKFKRFRQLSFNNNYKVEYYTR